MERFHANIQELTPKKLKQQKLLNISLGIIWAFLGLLELLSNKNLSFGYVYLIAGVLMAATGYFVNTRENKYFITFDDEGVSTYISFFNKFDIKWPQVKSIHITVLEIKFLLKDGTEKDIDLSLLGYTDVKITKEKIKEFAGAKGIPLS